MPRHYLILLVVVTTSSATGMGGAEVTCTSGLRTCSQHLGEAVADDLKAIDLCQRNGSLCFPAVLRLDTSVREASGALNRTTVLCVHHALLCTSTLSQAQTTLLSSQVYIDNSQKLCNSEPNNACHSTLVNISNILGATAVQVSLARQVC
eukprot:TRINITY_DN14564_c3_g2_i1.p1 TRINITY_DN14564_c3_g2~~TRINITY_DN14564_c3_g2_i1.p1  ORF type:complete len:164 (+),score=17.88 TRINITY_DN14564_c3_g2_i1:45-494(+)